MKNKFNQVGNSPPAMIRADAEPKLQDKRNKIEMTADKIFARAQQIRDIVMKSRSQ
eukprot:CAMPEP_0114504478 /NCGR_PEP_ID=MMETSP0109-20121206/10247_1 /TAXON_ID=29199 /ORGANISM="Chlorarachnion reptans, Strain CCCM449" /LENGTH=55 /DNA_ID=CAMNT_0001682665 /DNA_START=299 /DNA_END=463 /DNA_ORIENTATION=-